MALKIQLSTKETTCNNNIYLVPAADLNEKMGLSVAESEFILAQHKSAKRDWVAINRYSEWVIVVFVKTEDENSKRLEALRRIAFHVLNHLNGNKCVSACVHGLNVKTEDVLAFAEGMALSDYQFLKYRKDADEKRNSLIDLALIQPGLNEQQISFLQAQTEAVLWARDLVNEPLNALNATDLAHAISEKMRQAGGKAEVFNKKKIEALKMGGLLAVNLGSIDPPTFTILEWKPVDAINDKPIVLVGKGVVYDTGGMSLKPSGSMDTMKCDMAGSAVVSATIVAAAQAKLPLHLIALVPATDNRVNGNAYVPGDVITMFDGTTVEVLNTDAEGRLLLADALAYAKKFEPELVCNFATLTGAASRAIGSQGIVAMHVKAKDQFAKLLEAGETVYERLAEFPMWDEYKEQLKSDIADLKNIGGPEAGMITAGKFLEHFTDYPFVHFDIAGPAFLSKRDNYRGLGGTGTGIRLMFNYLSERVK